MKRLAQLLLIAMVIVLSTGAVDPAARYDRLSHQIMCTCSCSELLGECNHMGCPDSPGMLAHLRTAVDHGDPDKAILIDFQTKYGPIALAAPRFTRFNHIAWVLPPLLLALGVGLIAFTVRRWRLQPAAMPAAPSGFSRTELDDVRDRIRRETEG